MDYNNNEEKKRFAAAMSALYKTFRSEPDKDITKILFLTIKHLTIEDAEQCISQAILTCERFPTPVELKRCISLIPARPVKQLTYDQKPNQKLADESMRLINAILGGKVNREQTIEAMREMDRRHPNDGWAAEAAGLVQHYRMSQEVEEMDMAA